MSKVLKRATAVLAGMDGQPGVRHERAGADAHVAMEEGCAIPGGGRRALRRHRQGQALRDRWLGQRQGSGVTYEYDPITDRWTKKSPMPRPPTMPRWPPRTGRST
jgi:hypothetical protein